jgi:hypothetical protein
VAGRRRLNAECMKRAADASASLHRVRDGGDRRTQGLKAKRQQDTFRILRHKLKICRDTQVTVKDQLTTRSTRFMVS